MFLTYAGTVLCGIETKEFMVQFSWEHLELVGIPFGESRRTRALSQGQEREIPVFFPFKREDRNTLVKTKVSKTFQ